MRPLLIEVPYSHLFPGLWLRTQRAGYEPQHDVDVILIFADDSSAIARLRRTEGGGDLLLVGAYTTARGTFIDERVWRVQEIIADRGALRIHLGRRVRSGPTTR